MRKQLNLKKILQENPQVDRKLLNASAKLAQELCRLSELSGPSRRLASPFERKRAQVVKFSSLEL